MGGKIRKFLNSKKLMPTQLGSVQAELMKLEAYQREVQFKNYLRQSGHSMPKTRREFLNAGIIGFAATVSLPSVLEIILRQNAAFAADPPDCSDSAPQGLVPFIHIHLGGGAAMASQVVVKDKAGNMLPTYRALGLGEPTSFGVETDLGGLSFPTVGGALASPFLIGMRGSAGTTALGKTAMISICIRSNDDNSQNPLSAIGMIASAGLRGSQLPFLGSSATATGNRTVAAITAAPPPLVVGSYANLASAIQPSGVLAAQLSADQNRSLLKLIQNLSASQREKLAESTSQRTLAGVVHCATGKNLALASSTTNTTDPRQDTQIAALWGINTGTADNNAAVVQASLVYNALKGNAGGVSINLGGYDYHGDTRANTNAKDQEAGTLFGRIVRTAEILNSPVFIHVSSDGAVGGNTTTPADGFTTDRGEGGMGFMIAFNPTGRPAINGSPQIGSFTAGQGADETFITGWSPTKSACAVLANYLAFSKQLSSFDELTGSIFGVNDKDQVLKLG